MILIGDRHRARHLSFGIRSIRINCNEENALIINIERRQISLAVVIASAQYRRVRSGSGRIQSRAAPTAPTQRRPAPHCDEGQRVNGKWDVGSGNRGRIRIVSQTDRSIPTQKNESLIASVAYENIVDGANGTAEISKSITIYFYKKKTQYSEKILNRIPDDAIVESFDTQTVNHKFIEAKTTQ